MPTLNEILEDASPVKVGIDLALKDGTKFRARSAFHPQDRREAALAAIGAWLFIKPSAIVDIAASFGEIAPVATYATPHLEVAPMEAVYTKGDYFVRLYLTVPRISTRSPLRNLFKAYGDNWELTQEGNHPLWTWKPENVPPEAEIYAECAPLR